MRSEASSDDLIHVLLVGFDGPRAAALTSLFRDAPGLRVEAQAVAGIEPALAALAREPADLIVAVPLSKITSSWRCARRRSGPTSSPWPRVAPSAPVTSMTCTPTPS